MGDKLKAKAMVEIRMYRSGSKIGTNVLKTGPVHGNMHLACTVQMAGHRCMKDREVILCSFLVMVPVIAVSTVLAG